MTGVQSDAAPDPLQRQMRELERGLTIRTGELERENRRLRRIWMGTLIAVALLLGLATALVIVAARQGLPGTVASVVEARQFQLRDKDGNIRGSWSAADDGSMRFIMQTPGSKAGLSFSVLGGGASGITIRDSAGRSRAVLGLLPDQTVSMLFADDNGTTRTVLSLVRGGASTLVFADRSGSAKVGMGVDSRGQSTLTLPEPPESRVETPAPDESDPSDSPPATTETRTTPSPR